MRRRLFVGAATVAALVMFTTPVAWAVPPVHQVAEFDYAITSPDPGLPAPAICPFDVAVAGHWTADVTVYFDRAGNLTKVELHGIEQTTFSAHGKTLVGEPFRWNMQTRWDSQGNLIRAFQMAGLQRVPLPDGKVFWSAGRVNAIGIWWTILPDNGHSGNLDALCAALS
jgi:YD repeat-containing protein